MSHYTGCKAKLQTMSRSRPTPEVRALEMKGRLMSLTTLSLLSSDGEALAAQLARQARQMGAAVRGMPVVVDGLACDKLPQLLEQMRALGMQPVAALESPLAEFARVCGLPVLPADVLSETVRAVPAAPAPPQPLPVPVAVHRPARIISEPVRSGQQIYAEGCDLVLMNAVSVGAEVIADGCVHVYGRLSGRAIAGARGDTSARIFARRHEAELLAVAGIYLTAEQMPADCKTRPVQVHLVDGRLVVERLEG